MANLPASLFILKEKFSQEEYNELYRNLSKTNPELAKAMGPPTGSPFVSGDAIIVGYKSPTVIDRIRKVASQYGLEVDPDYPWIISRVGSRRVSDPRRRLFQIMDKELMYGSPETKYAKPKQLVSTGTPEQVNEPAWDYTRMVDAIFGEALRVWKNPNIATTMTAIAIAESAGKPHAKGDGGSSRGWWQINKINEELLARNGITWGDDLHDTKTNADAAEIVGRSMGAKGVDLSRWSVTHVDEQGNPAATRWYGDYQDQALEAAQRAGYEDVTGDFSGRLGSNDVRSYHG